jgi:hypothetical protein
METATEQKKVKFATQADPEVLAALRKIAGQEGRQLQALVDEALRGCIEQKQGKSPSPRIREALHDSMAEYDSLYRELSR